MNDYGMMNVGDKVLYQGDNPKNKKRFAGVVGIVDSRVSGANKLVSVFACFNRKTEETDRHVIMVSPGDLARIRA